MAVRSNCTPQLHWEGTLEGKSNIFFRQNSLAGTLSHFLHRTGTPEDTATYVSHVFLHWKGSLEVNFHWKITLEAIV